MNDTRLTVPAADIRFGHEYPGQSINVRKVDLDADHWQMVASIRADGLLLPIAVIEHEGAYYVVDGNRRLAALKEIGKPVPLALLHVIEVEDVPDALAKGLQANIQRVPLDIVDRFEAFTALIPASTEQQIADRFGIGVREVKRALALGQLSPKIRDALRKDVINLAAAEAFTLEPDKKKQESLFARLKKEGNIFAGSVRAAIKGEQAGAASLLKFVGRDAYLAKGGMIGTDLFAEEDADETFVGDYPLLSKMASEQLEDIRQRLLADGWGWVSMAHELPADWDWSWKKHPKAKASEREGLGVVLLLENGELQTVIGVEKPEAKKAAEQRAEKKKKAAPAISGAMEGRLTEALLLATKDALNPPKNDKGMEATLARIVAAQITPEQPSRIPPQVLGSLGLLRDLANADHVREALEKRFPAKDYFEKAPMPIILAAIEEISGKARRAELEGKASGMVRKAAQQEAKQKGWLPAQLRTSAYTGPGAKAKK